MTISSSWSQFDSKRSRARSVDDNRRKSPIFAVNMEKKNIRDLHRVSIDDFRSADKSSLVVVLDNVRSLNNIGSIFRTCDGFAVGRIMLCGITATPPSAEIHKTALGAELSMDWCYYPTTLEAVKALHAEGYTVCALEQVHGSVALPGFIPEKGRKYAIVAGHEVHGVSQEVVDAADICLEIPQFGTKHSLNVAVSTALAVYQLTFASVER